MEDLETLEFEEPEKNEQIKCTTCKSKGYCRKHSVMKGSMTCDVNRGIAEPKKKKDPSDQAKSLGLLCYLMQKKKEQ